MQSLSAELSIQSLSAVTIEAVTQCSRHLYSQCIHHPYIHPVQSSSMQSLIAVTIHTVTHCSHHLQSPKFSQC